MLTRDLFVVAKLVVFLSFAPLQLYNTNVSRRSQRIANTRYT